jgi:hypothetical protein
MMSIAQLMMMPPASNETPAVKILENLLPAIANNASLAASERLEALLTEAEAELAELAPQIEQLEQALEQLQALKQKRQRLLGLKSSLSALLLPTTNKATVVALHQTTFIQEQPNQASEALALTKNAVKNKTIKRQLPLLPPSSDGMFLPELAFKQGDTILKRKDSINYEIFRAIVYQGGQATTEQIRQYLIEQGVTVPKTGETFETVTLSEISARVSYLVKHGIARSVGAGSYLSCFGWDQPVQ